MSENPVARKLRFYDTIVLDKDLGGDAVRLAWVILNSLQGSDGSVRWTYEQLAERIGCSARNARRGVDQLRKRWFKVVNNGYKQPLTYAPAWESLTELSKTDRSVTNIPDKTGTDVGQNCHDSVTELSSLTHSLPIEEPIEGKREADASPPAEASNVISMKVTKGEGWKAMQAWNQAAGDHSWPAIKVFDGPRSRAIRSCLKQHGLDGWLEGIRRASLSDYLSPKSETGAPAKAPAWFDFDWLCKASNLEKVRNGKYGEVFDGGQSHGRRGSVSATDNADGIKRGLAKALESAGYVQSGGDGPGGDEGDYPFAGTGS